MDQSDYFATPVSQIVMIYENRIHPFNLLPKIGFTKMDNQQYQSFLSTSFNSFAS